MFTALLYSGCRAFSSYFPFFRRISQRSFLFIAKNPFFSDIDSPSEGILVGAFTLTESDRESDVTFRWFLGNGVCY